MGLSEKMEELTTLSKTWGELEMEIKMLKEGNNTISALKEENDELKEKINKMQRNICSHNYSKM